MSNSRNNERLFTFGLIITLIFILLVGRLYYLQINQGQKYQELSEGNRTSLRSITPPRGKIYDRNSRVLVSNRLAYTLSVVPGEIGDLDTFFNNLSEIIDLEVKVMEDKIDQSSKNKVVRLKRNLSHEEVVLLEEHRSELSGIILETIPVREYVYDQFASHALGYVGEISAGELKKLAKQGYNVGDVIGKTGIELIYEDYLRGKEGKELVEVNNLGKKIRTLGVKEPIAGYDLVLNLDYELQDTVEQILEEELVKLTKEAQEDDEIIRPPRGGAAIVMDTKDSSVLSIVSLPDYDPNLFVGGISSSDWSKISTNPKEPLLNRTINTSAPSGSIFKVVTAAAGMEELGIEADTDFYDPGYYKTGGVRFNNWATHGQGDISFLDGIAWSNNTVFYKVGHQLYKKNKTILQKYARQFGLGQKTQIDLNSETKGLVPDPEWRKGYYKDRQDQIWYPGYTINLSIGQGNLRTSPIQLVNFMSAVANGGKLHQPLIVDKILDREGKVVKDIEPKLLNAFSFDSETIDVLHRGLKGVTTYGTARKAFKDLPITVAGKTGTAQTGGNRANHGWFAGYVPADNPEIAIVVFLEYGSSSANTLPIAKRIIKEYFDVELISEIDEDI